MKKNKNLLLWIILTFLLVSISYSYFYFDKFSSFYVSDNLQELDFNLYIEWSDTPYSISNTFKSRSNYSISTTVNWNDLSVNLAWINKRWYIWFELTWWSWDKYSYLVQVKPNWTFLDADKLNYKVTPNISWFSDWTFDITLWDTETNENSLQSTWLNYFTDLYSYDWDYYYALRSWKIEKFSKNFHHLNTYDIDLW